jgi:hypothetical protein
MNKLKHISAAFLLLYLFAIILFPEQALATTNGTSDAEGLKKVGATLANEANVIKDFLFGAPVKLAGVLGGCYGLLQSVVGSNMRPLILYGGIGLTANMVPKFIDGVFTLLLP